MATQNSWGNTIADANVAFAGGTLSIGIDSTDNAINIGTGANTGRTTTIGNATGTSPLIIAAGSTGATLDATGVVQINSSAGAISIGNDDVDQAVNLGTDGERTVTLGSVNGAAALVMRAGTGTALLDAGGAIEINSSGSSIAIGNDDIDQAVNIASNGERVVTVGNLNGATSLVMAGGTLGATLDATGGVEINASAGAISIGNDDIDQAVNIATDGERAVTLGSVNGAASLVMRAGTGTALLDAGGAVEINSSAGAISIGNDAIAQAVNVGTAGARTVTVGNTTAGSSMALKYGTSDFTLASATGTVMSALDTGEITQPLQPAFLALHSIAQDNVTGAGGVPTINFTTVSFDQNSDYDGTNTFTAPITGRYMLIATAQVSNLPSGANSSAYIGLATSNQNYRTDGFGWYVARNLNGDGVGVHISVLCDMDASDTATVVIHVSGGAGNTADLPITVEGRTAFSGYLAC